MTTPLKTFLDTNLGHRREHCYPVRLCDSTSTSYLVFNTNSDPGDSGFGCSQAFGKLVDRDD